MEYTVPVKCCLLGINSGVYGFVDRPQVLSELVCICSVMATSHGTITDNSEATAEDRKKYKMSRYDFHRVIKGAK